MVLYPLRTLQRAFPASQLDEHVSPALSMRPIDFESEQCTHGKNFVPTLQVTNIGKKGVSKPIPYYVFELISILDIFTFFRFILQDARSSYVLNPFS